MGRPTRDSTSLLQGRLRFDLKLTFPPKTSEGAGRRSLRARVARSAYRPGDGTDSETAVAVRHEEHFILALPISEGGRHNDYIRPERVPLYTNLHI